MLRLTFTFCSPNSGVYWELCALKVFFLYYHNKLNLFRYLRTCLRNIQKYMCNLLLILSYSKSRKYWLQNQKPIKSFNFKKNGICKNKSTQNHCRIDYCFNPFTGRKILFTKWRNNSLGPEFRSKFVRKSAFLHFQRKKEISLKYSCCHLSIFNYN